MAKSPLIEVFGSLGLRRCGRCLAYLPIEVFYCYPNGKTDTYCTPCKRAKRKEWRDANSEKNKAQKRAAGKRNRNTSRLWWENHPEKTATYAENFRLKNDTEDRWAFYNHGIKPEQTRQIHDFQEGCCAICQKPIDAGPGGTRNIDHNHTTGCVRGLLCSSCNMLLGWYETRVDRIERYVSNPPAQQLGLEIISKRRMQDLYGTTGEA